MAQLLKGADVVAALADKMNVSIEQLKSKGVSPTLAIVRVGERPDDISYEKNAIKRCDSVGVEARSVVLPGDVTQDELLRCIEMLNNDDGVHGVLIFRPLPAHINARAVCEALCPEKDVDGITDSSFAQVFTGKGTGYAPCTAEACLAILDHFNIDCKGKRVVVIGHSLVVGRPTAVLLIGRDATVTVCHEFTKDVPSITKTAEIIIVAVGKKDLLRKEHFSPGQIVIDVGINWDPEKGKICGDVSFEDADPVVEAITPVPGGVGPVTISVLVSHVVEAAKKTLK